MTSGKYFLLIGCCILGNVVTASAAVECRSIPKCSDLGYEDAKSSCPAGYVGCPFNSAAVVCDKEADTGDFKLSAASVKNGWSSASTVYNNRFIVGAGTTSYCGVSSAEGLKADVLMTHTHSSASMADASVAMYIGLVPGDGVAEGDKNFNTYSTIGGDTSKITETGTNVYVGTGILQSSSSVLPFHKSVKGAFYSNPVKAATSIKETIASSTPKCADLGYVDTVSKCPGTYVKCPFDQSAVMCDLQAQAGEIKFSLQSSDHNGWLLCDGRTLSSKGTAYSKSELSSLMTTLPDYRGVFLKVSSSWSNTLQVDNLPSHAHDVKGYSLKKPTGSSAYTRSGDKSSKGKYWLINSKDTVRHDRTTEDSPVAQSKTPESGGDETAPRHYIANVFIYSGKLNAK